MSDEQGAENVQNSVPEIARDALLKRLDEISKRQYSGRDDAWVAAQAAAWVRRLEQYHRDAKRGCLTEMARAVRAEKRNEGVQR